MEEEQELVVNVEHQTIRGRVCPRCGGKIIPSDRAVYQAAVKGDETFPLWQCERCGYEEMARPQKVEKGKH